MDRNEENGTEKAARAALTEQEKATIVSEELRRILESRFFKNSLRSRQFLEYVVRNKLEGHAEQLKERTIGTEVFQRAPGYATGEDSVVRVQATEVRRRLEQYYESLQRRPAVRIDLQPGSYSPNISWNSEDSESGANDPKHSPAKLGPFQIPAISLTVLGLSLALLIVAGWLYSRSRTIKNVPTVQERFWAPAFTTPQPVMICLAKPVVYRPSFDLYRRYTETHPNTFQSEVERSNEVLPINPNDTIRWGEMIPYPDFGVAAGDVYAAVRVSSLLGQIGKPSQVRVGTNYSFEDLRNSPSVIVGAFNNRWTMQIMPGLHFSFVEDNRVYSIREQIPGGRVWRSNLDQMMRTGDDFAIVARLLDSRTGQFTIIAAGLTGSGTQVAGEFVSNSDYLERGLRVVPPDWQRKNMELILRTSITDSVPGPPQVIAYYVW